MKKINNFPDKEFKSILIRMLNGNAMLKEKNTVRIITRNQKCKRNQSEVKYAITEMKMH